MSDAAEFGTHSQTTDCETGDMQQALDELGRALDDLEKPISPAWATPAAVTLVLLAAWALLRHIERTNGL